MNTASESLIHILHIIKCFLFIIPLIISIRTEQKWIQNKIIVRMKFWHNTGNENSEQNNRFIPAKQFFMLNMFATVIAWNVFYSFNIPIPSIKFLITFLLLSVSCGIYLLYIRMNLKYEE